MITVALVEDDPLFRTTLVSMSAESARPALLAQPPEVALIDIQLPGLSGTALVAELAPKLPATAFVMLTSLGTDEAVFEALKAGAVGYLTKESDLATIEAAIVDARRGGSPMSWAIARKVVQSFNRPPVAPEPVPAPEVATLSPREHELVGHLARGLAYKQIADALGIGEETVRTHIRRIYKKLHVNSRTEAVVKFLGR
jgi:DNA-binding NarL/FixJ family response regulator